MRLGVCIGPKPPFRPGWHGMPPATFRASITENARRCACCSNPVRAEKNHPGRCFSAAGDDATIATKPRGLGRVAGADAIQAVGAVGSRPKPRNLAGLAQFLPARGFALLELPSVTATSITFHFASRNRRRARPPTIVSSSGWGAKNQRRRSVRGEVGAQREEIRPAEGTCLQRRGGRSLKPKFTYGFIAETVVLFWAKYGFLQAFFPGGFLDRFSPSAVSETQPNFISPRPRFNCSHRLSKDTQTSAKKNLFQAVQPGESDGGGHAQKPPQASFARLHRRGTRLAEVTAATTTSAASIQRTKTGRSFDADTAR